MIWSQCSQAQCRRSWRLGLVCFAELCSPKHFSLDLHCIGLSAEPLSWVDFYSSNGTVFELPFPWLHHGIYCSFHRHSSFLFNYWQQQVANNPQVLQFLSYSFRAFGPLQSSIYQSRLGRKLFQSHTEVSAKMFPQIPFSSRR